MSEQRNEAMVPGKADASCSVGFPGASDDCGPNAAGEPDGGIVPNRTCGQHDSCGAGEHHDPCERSDSDVAGYEPGDDDAGDDTPEETEEFFHGFAVSFRDYLVNGEPLLYSSEGKEASREDCMRLMRSVLKDMDPYWINRYLKI